MKIYDNGHDMKDGELWYAGFMGNESSYSYKQVPQIGIVKVMGDKPYQQAMFVATSIPGVATYGSDMFILGRAPDWPTVEAYEITQEDGKTIRAVRFATPQE